MSSSATPDSVSTLTIPAMADAAAARASATVSSIASTPRTMLAMSGVRETDAVPETDIPPWTEDEDSGAGGGDSSVAAPHAKAAIRPMARARTGTRMVLRFLIFSSEELRIIPASRVY